MVHKRRLWRDRGNRVTQSAYNAAKLAQATLDSTTHEDWAVTFVGLKMEWFRQFANGLVCSTSHGLDYFTNLMDAYDGKLKWNEEGDLGANFRKLTYGI